MLILCVEDPDPGFGAFLTMDPGAGINIPDSQHCLKVLLKSCDVGTLKICQSLTWPGFRF